MHLGQTDALIGQCPAAGADFPRKKTQRTYGKLFATPAVHDRSRFLQVNLACIQCVHARAQSSDIDEPVIVTIDLRGGDGAELASVFLQDELGVRRIIDKCSQEGSIPTAIVAVSHACAEQEIGAMFPDLCRELSCHIPPTSFHMIAIAFGARVHEVCRKHSMVGY